MFPKSFLVDELDLPTSAIEETIEGQTRWETHYSIVFEHPDGRFFQTSYSQGSTELQWSEVWEHEDAIACIQVEKKQVLVEKWVPVENEA